MGVSKTSDHIWISMKKPNTIQEPPVSSKSPNEALKDMDVLCTFKMKTESTWVGRGSPRPGDNENKKWLMSILFCSRASSKAPNEDLDMDVLCTFKIRLGCLMSKWICSWDIWCFCGLMRPRAQKMAHEHINLLTRRQDGEHMGWEGGSQTRRPWEQKMAHEHIILLTRQRDEEHMGVGGRGGGR